MLLIFFYSSLIVIFTIPYGLLLTNGNKVNTYHYTKSLIYGIIVVSFISLFINFFLPLNIYISSLIPLLSLVIIIIYKKKFFNLHFLKIILIIPILITILLIESNVYRPDAGLYHLPFIGILNSEKIIIGLSNLHFRYGHTSILQYHSAISNNFIFKENGIIFSQALVAVAIIINFSNQIYLYNKKKNYNFHFFFLIFIFIYISYKMNRYSEYGNDAPAHFLMFFLISEILLYKNKINYKQYGNNLILSLFIIQNKLTLIFLILFNLISLNKINPILLLRDKRFFFLSFFFCIWILKNILSTGCMLYPLKISCFEKLSWTNISEVKKYSQSSEIWTKDWSNLKSNEIIKPEEFLKNFNWLETWLDNHFKIIIKILFPYILISLLLIFSLTFRNNKKKYKNDKEYIYYFIILIFCSTVWFLKSPLYRYGYSFLISTLSFTFAFYCLKFRFLNRKDSKIINYILILGLSIILVKNTVRIYKTDNDYNNYPWPKYYSMNNDNQIVNFKEEKLDNISILKPIEGYCMYVQKICSHYGVSNDLKIKTKNNYYILYK